MMRSCSVWGCSARTKKGSGLGFFKFPKQSKYPGRRRRWINALKRMEPTSAATQHLDGSLLLGPGQEWEPGEWAYVCGKHFTTSNTIYCIAYRRPFSQFFSAGC